MHFGPEMEKEQGGGGGGVVVKGRATIDSRPPFRSVKEAVALFGERVLVGEIYAKQLKEMQVTKKATEKEEVSSTLRIVSAELEETKQTLQKTREEGNYMANCLKSLKQELEETKRELRILKATKGGVVKKDHPKVAINPEIEELKFVEINPNNNVSCNNNNNSREDFQRKKFVTFASPPSLTREIKESHHSNVNDERGKSKLGRTTSFRKEEKKKGGGGSIMGWFLPNKKNKKNNNNDGDHARSPTNN